MNTYILKENVLSDDLLLIADKGKVFKGGYFARVIHYTFANSWSDKENVKNFRKRQSLEKFLSVNYPDFEY